MLYFLGLITIDNISTLRKIGQIAYALIMVIRDTQQINATNCMGIPQDFVVRERVLQWLIKSQALQCLVQIFLTVLKAFLIWLLCQFNVNSYLTC